MIPDMDRLMESLSVEALREIQVRKLQACIQDIWEHNEFYRKKLRGSGLISPKDIESFEDLKALPFTHKEELSNDQLETPPFGTNLTYPQEHYTRIHQTSGTTGRPLLWLDTHESWEWWLRCWSKVYQAAGVTKNDRIFFAFSFGPFIGFWSAFEAAQRIGALAVPGGGMTSYQRAQAILNRGITVLVCTPTYALHLAEVAAQEGLDVAKSGVRMTIHAGEPGASLPATRARIESAWGSLCFDHAGATEVGAWGFEYRSKSSLHVNEGEFICEIIDPSTGEPADEGEMVMTNLGRIGMPVIRYKTGDRVIGSRSGGRGFLKLEGGVVGRIDDALVVRGVNVFPSAIENVIRQCEGVGEFAVHVRREKEMDDIEIQFETKAEQPEGVAHAVAREIQSGLGLRVRTNVVPMGSLPRFETKSKRFTDHRKK